jgi:hypothetical protein
MRKYFQIMPDLMILRSSLRRQMRNFFQIAPDLMILGLAGISFWFGITGILDGVVWAPGKGVHVQVLRVTSPQVFWVCVAIWLAIGVCFSWLIANPVLKRVLTQLRQMFWRF